MTLSWGEIFIILMVIGFVVGITFRAGIVRGQRKRRSKE